MKKQILPPGFILLLLLMGCNSIFAQENVGIGTLSPAYRLDVQGNATTPGTINLYSKVNYVGTSHVTAVEGYSKPADGVGYGGRFTGGYRGLEGYALAGTYSGAATGIYGDASGNAGNHFGVYGTSSGGGINYGVFGFVGGGANNYALYGSCPNALGYAGYFNGRGYFNDDLNANDKVGIGTSAIPTTKLQILGGSDVSLTGLGFIQDGPTNGQNLIIDDNEIMVRNNGAAADMFIQLDAGNLILCGNEQGGVGVGVIAGTSIPTGYLFAVDGKIISEELRIQNSNNWPDYVFADHYRLMPLEDLKKSIAINKHLPNIPSAAVVEKEGILVGDMQKHVMEKIEELTLYIIDMHDINLKQQAEINFLKAELQKLKEK